MTRRGAADLEIRALAGMAEYRAAVALQEATWGKGFSERVPASLMKVVQRTGGVAAGAFARSGELVGFVFGLTGLRDRLPVHWSDMLAVAAEWRGRGLGRALKLHQRDVVRRHGVQHMYWTVDPLEAANGHLNMNVLGARAVEYHRDFYGASDSRLHAGLATDRFVMEWRLEVEPGPRLPWDPEGVPAALAAEPGPPGGLPRPGEVATLEAATFRVAIPADVQAMKARDAGLARAWRAATREVLEPTLARGGRVDGLARRGHLAWLRVRRGPKTERRPERR